MANINRVILVGNLTRDPELRHTPSGTAVCKLRVAVNTRQKDAATGQWTDKPNYFDVTVWGNQGENCAQYLAKGRPVAIDGRLEWREWDAQDGTKRQAVEVVADHQRLGGGAVQEPRLRDAFHHLHERVPEAVDVEETDRLAVQRQGLPGPHLEELLERPEASGQGEECVRPVGHHRLALVHGVDDVQLAEVVPAPLALDHEVRNDADDLTARVQHALGDGAHEAATTAAVDEPDAPLGQGPADLPGRVEEGGVGAGGGGAEDREVTDGHSPSISRVRVRRSECRARMGSWPSSPDQRSPPPG